jgi:hypothetical protein
MKGMKKPAVKGLKVKGVKVPKGKAMPKMGKAHMADVLKHVL